MNIWSQKHPTFIANSSDFSAFRRKWLCLRILCLWTIWNDNRQPHYNSLIAFFYVWRKITWLKHLNHFWTLLVYRRKCTWVYPKILSYFGLRVFHLVGGGGGGFRITSILNTSVCMKTKNSKVDKFYFVKVV